MGFRLKNFGAKKFLSEKFGQGIGPFFIPKLYLKI